MISNPFWPHRQRRGVTLVEVVAASTLMASLLVGILLAYGRHQQQLRSADKQLQALAITDQLLESWGEGAQLIPLNQTGIVAKSERGWLWRTSALKRHYLGETAFDVVRLEVFGAPVASRRTKPLTAVDVLVGTPDIIDR